MLRCITSWDDGHPLDLKLAELLKRYQIPGTFYIPIKNSENKPTVNKKQILQLSHDFTIGGHTYSHRDLTALSPEQAKTEVQTGKDALEQILGNSITEFCYPRGKYTPEIETMVKSIGFKRARSARLFSTHDSTNDFTYHPNLHWYPHMSILRVLHCFKQNDLVSAARIPTIVHSTLSETALRMMPHSESNTIHIWGHSWEVVTLGLLPELERFFKAITA